MSIAMAERHLNNKKEGTLFQMKFIQDSRCSSSSSSSIGKNSDLSDEEREKMSDELQREYNGAGGGPFDSMQALEEVLPMRRGISSFYSGKSKSFASLSYLANASAKEIAKPDNAYSRRRRNLMASSSHIWDQLHKSSTGGTQKRSMRTSRSTLALGVAMSRSSSSSGSSQDSNCS